LTEKNIYSHLDDPVEQDTRRDESFLKLTLDRVATQDATSQMAKLRFMTSGLKRIAVSTTTRCDRYLKESQVNSIYLTFKIVCYLY